MAETEHIPLDRITTEGTQARVILSETIIREYAEAMTNGDAFPPIDVYFDDTVYWLADGFHRVSAATIAGQTTIAAVVHEGGKREALLHAVSANETHGHRRTEADRRHAVSLLLADPEWQAWNNSEIARHCRVSEFLVRTLRRELEPPHATPEPSVRTKKVQRGGTTYTMRTGRIGAATPSKTPPVVARTASTTESIPPAAPPEQQEGMDAAPASSMASKTDIPPAPALYVHDEETPAGPVVSTQTEDEIAGEPIMPPPPPRLIEVWQQASDEERQTFVVAYRDVLQALLAALQRRDDVNAQPHKRASAVRGKPPQKQRKRQPKA